MNREEAFTKLFALEEAVGPLSTFVKRKLGVPITVIHQIDRVGDLAEAVEAYGMANNDRDILMRMSQIERGYLAFYLNNYDFDNYLLKETRASIEKALKTFSRIYLSLNPEILLDEEDQFGFIPFELTGIVETENNEKLVCKTDYPETIKKTKNQGLVKIDEESLKPYFKANFKGAGNHPINYFGELTKEIESGIYNNRELAQIALMIHKSKHKTDRIPVPFSKWYGIFSNCIGVEKMTFQPKDLKPIGKRIKSLFSYLEPENLD